MSGWEFTLCKQLLSKNNARLFRWCCKQFSWRTTNDLITSFNVCTQRSVCSVSFCTYHYAPLMTRSTLFWKCCLFLQPEWAAHPRWATHMTIWGAELSGTGVICLPRTALRCCLTAKVVSKIKYLALCACSLYGCCVFTFVQVDFWIFCRVCRKNDCALKGAWNVVVWVKRVHNIFFIF